MDIRVASAADVDPLFELVDQFTTTFPDRREAFEASLLRLVADSDALLLVADAGHACLLGYLLGFDHPTFYANGRVGWIEEAFVTEGARGRGVGRALTVHFEQWARRRDAVLIGLATRRAEGFYAALGYQNSAVYLRKLL